MIVFDNVAKRYDTGLEALSQVSFEIDAGEMLFLTGHSGAGKSTLLKLLAALERPTRGLALVNGVNMGKLSKHQIPYFRRQLGFIFQNHRLLYDRTVYDNVALPLVISGLSHADTARRVRAALDQVDLLRKERCYPIELSGGEQQRVGIARAVVNKPTILLADEPTGNLDPELSEDIMALFERFNNFGVTVFIASHDLDLIDRMGHRVIRLANGQVVADDVLHVFQAAGAGGNTYDDSRGL